MLCVRLDHSPTEKKPNALRRHGLREFYSLHDGQEQPTGGGDLIGSLFPNFGLPGLDELVANHKYCRDPDNLHDDNLHDTEYLGDDWGKIARQQQAGEVVDDCDPVSASLTDFVNSVRFSIESGTKHSGLLPTGEEAHSYRTSATVTAFSRRRL